jgi:hypothetical protein
MPVQSVLQRAGQKVVAGVIDQACELKVGILLMEALEPL